MTGSKWLRQKEARGLPEYVKLIEAAADRLTSVGRFSKEEICEAAGMSSFVDAIRWDYLVNFLEEEYETEIIPMAGTLFKRHKADDERNVPGRYMASGHGKKTVGYIAATRENGHFVIHRLRNKIAVASGCHKAAERTHAIGVAKQVENLPPCN